MMIFHIAERDGWDLAKSRGIYAPASLETEGFIHCSTREQVEETATLFYRGRTDLVLLRIDEDRLDAPLKFETATDLARRPEAARFPHIHGALNLSAVIDVRDLRCDPDGTFRLISDIL
jgi:uncharacterized protein (DUF952 family)